jgi:hypothetical protein
MKDAACPEDSASCRRCALRNGRALFPTPEELPHSTNLNAILRQDVDELFVHLLVDFFARFDVFEILEQLKRTLS